MDADEIVGHRVSIRSDEITSWAGFPITTPARTWLDLAARLTLIELVVVGDFLVRRDQPLCSMRELAEAGARYPSRRGIISIRAALPLIRTRSESPRETKLRLVIVWAGLPEPESNFNIYDSTGRFLARADLAYPEYRTMIEFQGDQHRTNREQWRHDIQRTGTVEDNGWQVLQFTDDDLSTLDAQARLVERIRLRLSSRGWLSPAPGV
jgi:very-short-patch-repair endonuclease